MAITQTAQRLPPGRDFGFGPDFPNGALDGLLALFHEFGDVYKVSSPATGRDAYVVSHPEHVRHVLVGNHRNYTKGGDIERVKILLGNGIMVSEGEFWRRQRKMIQPAFHRKEMVHYLDLIRRCNLDLFERWQSAADGGTSINLTQDMSEVTLEIVLRSIFSEDLDTVRDAHGANPFAIVTDEPARDLKFAARFRGLTKLVLEIIVRRRREQRMPFDLLSMLMQSRDKGSGAAMTDRELIDEVMTLIVAGHETTASGLNWTWYLLSQSPEVEARLHAELDRVCGDGDFRVEQLNDLVYTGQVIDEALRLYPPGWLLTRRAIGDDEIGGYHVPAGTDVFISPYLIHRHPGFWSEPEAFRPERFDPVHGDRIDRFAYLPFAAGARQCVGEHFALVEMSMHLATLARRLRLRYVPDRPIELESHVNLRSRHPLRMQAERRGPSRRGVGG